MIDQISYDKNGNPENFVIGYTAVVRRSDGYWRIYSRTADETQIEIDLKAEGPIRASYSEYLPFRSYESKISDLEAKIERLRAAQAEDDAARAKFWNARIDAEMAAAAKSLEVEIPRDLITETPHD